MEKLKKFINFILLPILAIIAILKLVKGNKEQDSLETMLNTEKKDKDLAVSETALKSKADEQKNKADDIEKDIKEIKESDGDENWHLKLKK